MFPADKLCVFAGQCLFTLKGDGAAVFRQTRKIWHQHVVRRSQGYHVIAAVILIDADNIKQIQGKGDQFGIFILIRNFSSQLITGFAAVGMHLQKAVTALFQLLFQYIMGLPAFRDKFIKTTEIRRVCHQVNQSVVIAVIDGAAGRTGIFKGFQTFVEPAQQDGLCGIFQIRDAYLNITFLADTVETADTLLQQIRVKRQIEHHQLIGKLEVTPFRTDFRAEQHLCAFLFGGKVGRRPVAFQQGHILMENRSVDAFALAQNLLQLQSGCGLGTNYQHFFIAVCQQEAEQPFNTRVEVPPGGVFAFKFLINLLRIEHLTGFDFRGFFAAHDPGDFNRGLILCRQRHFNRFQFAAREAFHTIAGVAEQQAAGAVSVHQHADKLATGIFAVFTVGIGGFQQRLNILFGDQVMNGILLIFGQRRAVEQQSDRIGNRLIFLLFGNKGFEIMETVRIQQAQTRKVALHAQLFRSSGQQEYRRNAFCQGFNHLILTAWCFFAPDQMVCFIHHQHIPAGFRQVFKTWFAFADKIQ